MTPPETKSDERSLREKFLVREGAAKERAAIVAWLRRGDSETRSIADYIEHGLHERKDSEMTPPEAKSYRRRRFYLDTEFHEDGRIIDLISIALVRDDGSFYYAVSTEFDPAICNDWVKANVLPKLPPREEPLWKSRSEIADDVRTMLLKDGKPEVWGYFADYDWVVLCQLYGRMVDLPKGFPFYCRDLKQLLAQHGIEKEALPSQVAEHDALDDAQWIRSAHRWLMEHGYVSEVP